MAVPLPSPGHIPAADEIDMPAVVTARYPHGESAAVVEAPLGTDTFVQDHAMKVVRGRGRTCEILSPV